MIQTTCIGAYPKPEFVALPDWFSTPEGTDTSDPTKWWTEAMAAMGDDAERIISEGVAEGIHRVVDSSGLTLVPATLAEVHAQADLAA